MSIICKTGCGQQVDYENIEFTDGFVYTVPHNLDQSIHYCPIFHDQSSLFSNPGGSHPFDSKPNREIIFIKYDTENMRYLYLCTTCSSSWKNQ